MPAEAHSVGASKDRPRRGGRLRRNCWGGSPQRARSAGIERRARQPVRWRQL